MLKKELQQLKQGSKALKLKRKELKQQVYAEEMLQKQKDE
jgi:hypothetical protein